MCGASGNWEAMLLQPSTQICAQQTRVFACGPVIRFGVSASPHSNQEHMHFLPAAEQVYKLFFFSFIIIFSL